MRTRNQIPELSFGEDTTLPMWATHSLLEFGLNRAVINQKKKSRPYMCVCVFFLLSSFTGMAWQYKETKTRPYLHIFFSSELYHWNVQQPTHYDKIEKSSFGSSNQTGPSFFWHCVHGHALYHVATLKPEVWRRKRSHFKVINAKLIM